ELSEVICSLFALNITKKNAPKSGSAVLCPEQDSNLQACGHPHLKRACLPISPSGLKECKYNFFSSTQGDISAYFSASGGLMIFRRISFRSKMSCSLIRWMVIFSNDKGAPST